MRVLTFVIVLFFPILVWAADAKTTVTGKQGDRKPKFVDSLGTYYEGLVVALLGNCSSESGPTIATKEGWEKALTRDHLLVQFAKPRLFMVTGEPPEVKADEIVVPISPSDSPDHIFVRTGKSYRAFAKYDHKICSFIQENLKLLLTR